VVGRRPDRAATIKGTRNVGFPYTDAFPLFLVRRFDDEIEIFYVRTQCLASVIRTPSNRRPLRKNESSKKYSLCTLLRLGLR
jgi:hypothetical protein